MYMFSSFYLTTIGYSFTKGYFPLPWFNFVALSRKLIFISLHVEKNVSVTFFSGEREKYKIMKICDAFGANCYPFTDD